MNTKKELQKRAETFFAAVHAGLHKMPAAELRKLKEACANLTTTNCWWATYELGPILTRAIVEQQAFRKSCARSDPRRASELTR